MESYDCWKTEDQSGAGSNTVLCDYCGSKLLLDDAQEYREVYVCSDCLENLEADDEELNDDYY